MLIRVVNSPSSAFTFIVLFFATIVAAEEQILPILPAQPHRYEDNVLPKRLLAVLREMENTPKENPITDAGASLGRVLFL